ncbi:ComF family protein [Streptomyces sp. HNM0574]|uniref:ComF family protein n=1 Tax=Streptomyces sp. HNM0574 TaxID=2714954 RepID=UPI00146CE578|nr:ComF family protein [Streptomyces sp. HNM0574]NLU67399.1 ComF family protein [Streptomyces sp. HNM0574]
MRDTRTWWDGIRQELAGLVLPADCAGCGLPCRRGQLCESCTALLTRAPPRRVRPARPLPGLPPVHAALTYADEARAVLLAHKERGALGLAAPLGTALARAVRAAVTAASGPPGALVLVPVPSARTAVARRGHDPARRIAAAAARELRRAGLPARVLPVLRQRRPTADQAGLDAAQRRANLGGALEAHPGGLLRAATAGGGRTVLVDDVLTTGASLAEAARATGVADGAAGAGAPVAAVVAVRTGV